MVIGRTVDGKCIKCACCCSNILPLTDKEWNTLNEMVIREGLKPCNPDKNYCFFLDYDHKCTIYYRDERPEICKKFVCNEGAFKSWHKTIDEVRKRKISHQEKFKEMVELMSIEHRYTKMLGVKEVQDV